MSDVNITAEITANPILLRAQQESKTVLLTASTNPIQVVLFSVRPLVSNVVFLPGSSMAGIEIITDTLVVLNVEADSIVTVPEGAIAISAYATSAHALKLLKGVDWLQLTVGEQINNEQMISPGKVPFWAETKIFFPAGSSGTVTYSALSAIGSITIEAAP